MSPRAGVLHLRSRRGVCRIPENRDPSDARHCFAQQLETLSGDFGRYIGETRNVASWSSETAHKAGAHRVARHGEDDGHGFGRTPGRVRRLRPLGHYGVDL